MLSQISDTLTRPSGLGISPDQTPLKRATNIGYINTPIRPRYFTGPDPTPSFSQSGNIFQRTETGLSDFHGLVVTLMRTHIPRLRHKLIKYRSYKKFEPEKFLQDVNDFITDVNDADLSYRNLSSVLRTLVDKHAPLKTKVQRGNTAPFMNQQLQKAIYARSRLKRRFNRNPTAENRTKLKKQRNKCVSIRKKAMKNHFKEATKNGTMSNKEFWDLVKPFLSNKGGLTSSNISLVKNDTVIIDDQELTGIFNDH